MVRNSSATAEQRELVLEIDRVFNAPRALIWRLWRDPETLQLGHAPGRAVVVAWGRPLVSEGRPDGPGVVTRLDAVPIMTSTSETRLLRASDEYASLRLFACAMCSIPMQARQAPRVGRRICVSWDGMGVRATAAPIPPS